MPTFEEFIASRDYTGALTLLEVCFNFFYFLNFVINFVNHKKFNSKTDTFNLREELWRAFCHFRLAEYKKAVDVYKKIQGNLKSNSDAASDITSADIDLFIGCCKFYTGDFIAPGSFEGYEGEHKALANRIRLYLNRKKDFKEDRIEEIQAKLSSVITEFLSVTPTTHNLFTYRQTLKTSCVWLRSSFTGTSTRRQLTSTRRYCLRRSNTRP